MNVPQSIAKFEAGESRGEIRFNLTEKSDGSIIGNGNDSLYSYQLTNSDISCNGTLFIRNKNTGELKAIPIENYMNVTKENCLYQSNNDLSEINSSNLFENFGTRASQRILKMRQKATK